MICLSLWFNKYIHPCILIRILPQYSLALKHDVACLTQWCPCLVLHDLYLLTQWPIIYRQASIENLWSTEAYLASTVLTREKRNNPLTHPRRREHVSQARVFDPWHIIETIGYVVVDASQSGLRRIYRHVLSILFGACVWVYWCRGRRLSFF